MSAAAIPTSDASADAWQRLLGNAQGGLEMAIAKIYRTHNPSVLRYLRVCDINAAEDIASSVWMDAARSLKGFEGTESAFVGWLFTIVRRRLIDHQRAQARPETRIEVVSDPSADAWLIANAEAAAVAAVVRENLQSTQAEVVLMRSVAGLSVAEVALALEKSEAAVRVLQHRGLRKLAKVFTPESFSEEVKQNGSLPRSS